VDIEAGVPPGENALGPARAQQLLADKKSENLPSQDLLLLDAAPADLLKCDGFLAKTLIYIPSATICRQGKESSA